jgi:hypothetical protein
MRAVDALLLLVSIVLCLYLLPTLIEIEMMKHITVWVSCIFFGDLVGCSFLSWGLGWQKIGVLLYGFLTACEGWAYAEGVIPPHVLVWLPDIGPTVVCLAGLFFLRPARSRVVHLDDVKP